MKKSIFILMLSLLFIAGCSDSGDSAGNQTEGQASEATEVATDVADSTGQAIEEAAQTVTEAADEVVAESKELAETAVAAADNAVQEVKQATEAVKEKVAATGDSSKGAETYKAKCVACHGAGVAGSPKLGDTANWAPRIAQGEDVMVKHAIEGFKGNTGFMPPKGGAMDLTDDQVRDAVVYMVSQSK